MYECIFSYVATDALVLKHESVFTKGRTDPIRSRQPITWTRGDQSNLAYKD